MSDLVVVELAGSTAGAYTAKLLGDLGAVVVMLEPPGGAPMRADAAQWATWATSRVTLPIDSAAAAAWMSRADVVIESSARAALGPLPVNLVPSERAVNVRISPFGSYGPYASWSSADIIDQAIGGHLFLSGRPDREPLQGPHGQAALAAGVFGAIGAMAALLVRSQGGRSGKGQSVEVTHHEALASLHQFTDVRFTHAGNVLKRMGNRYAGPGSPIGMYRAADGWMALTVSTAAHAEVLLAITGLDTLLEHPEIHSVTDLMVNAPLFEPAFERWLSTQKVNETVELFQSARIAAGPVLTMREIIRDPHLEERSWWQDTMAGDRSVRIPGPPFRIGGMPWHAAAAVDAGGPPPPPGVTDDPSTERTTVANQGPDATLPLDGLRVLDLTRVWAGPLAARILGELGADVVMVEAPWARTPLTMPESYVQSSHFFPDDDQFPHPWNRQGFVNKFAITKRSLAMDISSPAGREVLERLVANADVLIENYSPRVMPNLGFTDERLREINPGLIYVTMPGYGRTGPAKDYSAYGPVLDSHAGLSTLMGYPDVDAWKCGIAWPDPVAGIHTAFAVLAALWERSTESGGTTIEVAQFETAVAMIADRLVRAQLDEADPQILGNRDLVHAPQGVYPTVGDDCWLAVAVTDELSWQSLCSIVEWPEEWAGWSREERVLHHDEIDAALSRWTGTRSAPEAASYLQSYGIAAAPVVDASLLFGDPHLGARSFYSDVEHPEAGRHHWGLSCAARLSVTPARITRPAPCLGQHNREVLRAWAGLDDAQIDALVTQGTVADRPPA